MRVPGALDPSRFTWTDAQRRVLLVLLTILLISLAAKYAFNSMYVSDPQPETGPHYNDLADKIDPNKADWQTLAALPGIRSGNRIHPRSIPPVRPLSWTARRQ